MRGLILLLAAHLFCLFHPDINDYTIILFPNCVPALAAAASTCLLSCPLSHCLSNKVKSSLFSRLSPLTSLLACLLASCSVLSCLVSCTPDHAACARSRHSRTPLHPSHLYSLAHSLHTLTHMQCTHSQKHVRAGRRCEWISAALLPRCITSSPLSLFLVLLAASTVSKVHAAYAREPAKEKRARKRKNRHTFSN